MTSPAFGIVFFFTHARFSSRPPRQCVFRYPGGHTYVFESLGFEYSNPRTGPFSLQISWELTVFFARGFLMAKITQKTMHIKKRHIDDDDTNSSIQMKKFILHCGNIFFHFLRFASQTDRSSFLYRYDFTHT